MDDSTSIETVAFEDVPMRVWFKSDAARKSLKLDDLKKAIEDPSPSGLLGKYHALVLEADQVMKETRKELQAHRNLCEDYCAITAVAVEDVAVCTDIELDPAADIEGVLAEAFYQIDQYFSPDIKFHSLKELMDKGVPVEEIFEGPKLRNGFIEDAQVDSTNLRTVLYTSDIINLLMDIPGVMAIRNFTLAKYDSEGKQVGPAEPWELPVSAQHQPRFYPQASKFLVFKNGLPFLPDNAELNDVLQVIRGTNSQPKFPDTEKDLLIPSGTYYPLQDYFPIQYQLPLTYGVGYEGLPSTASVERVAQARQLKAYLLFFEQMLVDYLAQLANVGEFFAIDEAVDQTYFSRFISDDLIKGITSELYRGFDAGKLQALSESRFEFLDRRNRLLDHLLARFAESFSDYALMLYRYAEDKTEARKQLIGRKIAFLKNLPAMTHDRAKAFDYTAPAAICGGATGKRRRPERAHQGPARVEASRRPGLRGRASASAAAPRQHRSAAADLHSPGLRDVRRGRSLFLPADRGDLRRRRAGEQPDRLAALRRESRAHGSARAPRGEDLLGEQGADGRLRGRLVRLAGGTCERRAGQGRSGRSPGRSAGGLHRPEERLPSGLVARLRRRQR